MPFLKQRLPAVRETFFPGWNWIAPMIFLGIVGAAQAFRDELLPPWVAENYHLLQWLPDIDWKWYALAILAIVILSLMESANQAISKRDRVLGEKFLALCKKTKADNVNMLGAVAVTPLTNCSHGRGGNCALQCALEITAAVPIQYYIHRFEASYEGISCPDLPKIARLGIATPMAPSVVPLPFVSNIPWTDGKRWRGNTRYTVRYGPLVDPNGYLYRIDGEVYLEVSERRTTLIFAVDSRAKI